MPLKYSIQELFSGRFPNPKHLYDQLKDLDRKIQDGADATPIVKSDVKLTKSALKKAFGNPQKFDNIGVVHNTEGSYLVIAHDKEFKIISFDNI